MLLVLHPSSLRAYHLQANDKLYMLMCVPAVVLACCLQPKKRRHGGSGGKRRTPAAALAAAAEVSSSSLWPACKGTLLPMLHLSTRVCSASSMHAAPLCTAPWGVEYLLHTPQGVVFVCSPCSAAGLCTSLCWYVLTISVLTLSVLMCVVCPAGRG
jgi:hypothetical protein